MPASVFLDYKVALCHLPKSQLEDDEVDNNIMAGLCWGTRNLPKSRIKVGDMFSFSAQPKMWSFIL